MEIDTKFNFKYDTPLGKDPDSFSPTLRRYHKSLWSKQLPIGQIWWLEDSHPKAYLHHSSEIGEFFLGSDAITNSYRNMKKLAPILCDVPKHEVEELFEYGNTIGAYILFPNRKIDNKMTINGARGCNAKICDRFDLTLECIRLFYEGQANPLDEVLNRYADFFALYSNFRGYVDFFHLQDLVTSDYSSIRYHLPHSGFDTHPLPVNSDEYLLYKENTVRFVKARNNRIQRYCLER